MQSSWGLRLGSPSDSRDHTCLSVPRLNRTPTKKTRKKNGEATPQLPGRCGGWGGRASSTSSRVNHLLRLGPVQHMRQQRVAHGKLRCNVSHLVGRNGQLEAWGAWKQPRAHAYLGETMSQPENDKTVHEGLRNRPRRIYSWRSRSWVTPSHRPPSSKTPGPGADPAKRGPGLVSVHLAEQGPECIKPSWLCRGRHRLETIILQPVQMCKARCGRKCWTRWGQRSLGPRDQSPPVSSPLHAAQAPAKKILLPPHPDPKSPRLSVRQQLEGVLTRRRGAGVQRPPVATKQPCPGPPWPLRLAGA